MPFETAGRATADDRPGACLPHCLLAAAALGTLTVLSLPPARGVSEWFGWLPLWWVAMPLTAWLAALCLRSPRRRRDPEASPALRRRRPSPAPRRRHGPGAVRRRLPRAA